MAILVNETTKVIPQGLTVSQRSDRRGHTTALGGRVVGGLVRATGGQGRRVDAGRWIANTTGHLS